MTHVEARKWIKRLPEGRGQALDAGAKAVLQELWDHVTWTIERNATGRECWPSRRRIAEEIGTTAETVKKRLDRLAAAGWIRRDGDGWALAWATPFPDAGTGLPGEPMPRPRGTDAPPPGNRCPAPGEPMPHNQGTEPSIDQSTDHATPAAPDHDASGAGSPMQGSETAQDHPCKGQRGPSASSAAALSPTSPQRGAAPSRESGPRDYEACDCVERSQIAERVEGPHPTKPRRRRSPAAGQAALDLGAEPSEPDVVVELLALHQRLRAKALAHHHERLTELPKPTSKAGQAMRRGLRAALKARGRDWCERMLRWRGQAWLDDSAQLTYSAKDVWTKPCLEYAAKAMGQPARASPPGRAPRLSAPPPGEAPEYVPSFEPGSENEPCETF